MIKYKKCTVSVHEYVRYQRRVIVFSEPVLYMTIADVVFLYLNVVDDGNEFVDIGDLLIHERLQILSTLYQPATPSRGYFMH